MNDIHDSTSALYEALIDEEESEAISVIKSLQKKLKSILISITDE
jgi:sensor domain CHASE-containing protein